MFVALMNEYKALLKTEKVRMNLFEIIGFIVIVVGLITGTVFSFFSKEVVSAGIYIGSCILLVLYLIILAKTHPKSAIDKQIDHAKKHKKELIELLAKYRIDPRDDRKLEAIVEMAKKEKNASYLPYYNYKETPVYTLVVVPVITLIVDKVIGKQPITEVEFWVNVGSVLSICAIAGVLFWEARSIVESVRATSRYPYEMIIKDIEEIELFKEDLLIDEQKKEDETVDIR